MGSVDGGVDGREDGRRVDTSGEEDCVVEQRAIRVREVEGSDHHT